MKTNLSAFFLKTSVLVAVLATVPLPYSIPLCLFLTWGYQYVIGFFFGLKVMPSMDMVCFFGDDKANV